MPTRQKPFRLVLAAAFALLVAVVPAQAQASAKFTWTGAPAPATTNWSNAANWAHGSVPTAAAVSPALDLTAATQSVNDVPGVKASHLEVTAGGGLNLTGDGLALGQSYAPL